MTTQNNTMKWANWKTLCVLSLLAISSCKKEGLVTANEGPPESIILEACQRSAGNLWGGGNISEVVRGTPLASDSAAAIPAGKVRYPIRVVYQELQEQPLTWDPVTKLPRPGDWKAAPKKGEYHFTQNEFGEWKGEHIRSGWLSPAPGPLINDNMQRAPIYEAYKKANIAQLEALLAKSKAADQKSGGELSRETKLRKFWLESARNIQKDLNRDESERVDSAKVEKEHQVLEIQRQAEDDAGSKQPNGPQPHSSDADLAARIDGVNSLTEKAAGGDADAQYLLSRCYSLGENAPRDVAQAMVWLRKAAAQGHPKAQYVLGYCYGRGEGVSVNYSEAVRWFSKSAERGNADAQRALGQSYFEGLGVEKNHSEAVSWFRKASEQGNAVAQYSLGLCYRRGEGVPQDDVEAAKWIRKSAEQGDAEAQSTLGQLYLQGSGLPKDESQAIAWIQKSAEQGHAFSEYTLGVCYGDGIGVPKDGAESYRWYRKSAEQGYAEAQISLGVCYANGFGVAKADAQAAQWFKKAAESGHAAAQCILGCCYHDGRGVPEDYVAAYSWLNLSAASGYTEAIERRDQIAAKMTKEEIAEGQKLSREWQSKRPASR